MKQVAQYRRKVGQRWKCVWFIRSAPFSFIQYVQLVFGISGIG